MNIANMRAYVANAYPGRSWKARVNVMRDQQIIAIYHSIVEREKPKQKINRGKKQDDPGYQFTIFDMLKEDENEKL